MNEENVAIRLKGFIDYLGISSSQFADQCGIPRPSLSQLLNGRNKKISDVLVGQIHTAFPELSVLWLMFGEGPMLVQSKIEESSVNSEDNGTVANSISTDEDTPKVREDVSNVLSMKNESANLNLSEMITERDQLIKELRKEIEQLKKHPRRVSQITIYYDDSTFETFLPGSMMGKSH